MPVDFVDGGAAGELLSAPVAEVLAVLWEVGPAGDDDAGTIEEVVVSQSSQSSEKDEPP